MLLEIHPDNPNPRNLQVVIDCLKKGGVIIYPTDTVYGFGCDINNPKAIERVARIKGTKTDKKHFSFICYDLSHISDYARQIDNNIFKLMKKCLPGAYTFILNASSNVPKLLKSKKKTVGIRVPDNNIAREIIRMLGNPIISSSLHDENGEVEYTTDPELIHERYENQVDIVINGGYGEIIASTVLDCTTGEVEIIREGGGEIFW